MKMALKKYGKRNIKTDGRKFEFKIPRLSTYGMFIQKPVLEDKE